MFVVEEDNHNELKIQLKEIAQQINNINSITVDQEKYVILKTLSGDKKSLDDLMGKNGSNSNYSCLYCESNLKKKWNDNDHLKKYPINRTLKRAKEICRSGKTKVDDRLGYINEPIFD